jgi:hypothetical protein
MIKPDVIAKIQLYSEAQGGRRSATPLDHLGCQFDYEGEYFDCRLLLQDVGPIAPGESATVPIKFLRPELVKSRLQVGSRFNLREIKIIGEGIIESIPQ